MRFKSSRVLVALVAVCAMTAVAAASASAYTNPILENAKGEHVTKVKFTGRTQGGSGIVALENKALGDNGVCNSEEGTGELSTTGTGSAAKTSGTATFTFKGCKETQELSRCETGETSGEMVYKTSLSLVWLGKESEESLGWLAAIAPESKKPGNGEGGKLKFTCAGKNGIKNELEGGFVATLGGRGLGVTFTEGHIEAKISEFPKQEYTKYTEEGVEQESTFWSKLQEFAFEPAATELEQFMLFPETVKIVKS
jgi:hypothetical protein